MASNLRGDGTRPLDDLIGNLPHDHTVVYFPTTHEKTSTKATKPAKQESTQTWRQCGGEQKQTIWAVLCILLLCLVLLGLSNPKQNNDMSFQ